QPVLFAIEVALASLWASWGVHPSAVIGHSMGEVAAARIAGVLSLEDAAAVICQRSLLLRRLVGQGAMGVVELGVADIEPVLERYGGRITVGGSNAPRTTLLSGEVEALEVLMAELTGRGVFCRMVRGTPPSHGPQVDVLLPDMRALLQGIEARP